MRVEVLGGGSVGAGEFGEIPGSFEPPLQVRQLPVNTPGVSGEQYRHAISGPLCHLSRWDPIVEPLGQAGVPVVIHTLPGRRIEDVRSQDRSASTAPGPADDGAREDAAVLALEQEITWLELFVFDVLPQNAGQGGMPRHAVLRVPRLGVLNVHPSLLPRHRGPMPVHWAVRHGDPETGVTVHWMVEAFDSGPVVAQRGGVVLPDDLDGEAVFTQIRATIRDVVAESLELAEEGFAGTPQDEAQASYEGVIGPDSAVIDWSRPAREVHNLVRTYRFVLFALPGPLSAVGGGWVSVLRTSTQPGSGVRMRCGDVSLWVVESVPVPAHDRWWASSPADRPQRPRQLRHARDSSRPRHSPSFSMTSAGFGRAGSPGP